MAEISAIMNKYDIAGSVILHAPTGNAEVKLFLEPTYSCLTVNGDNVRLKSKANDYENKAAQESVLKATSNLVSMLAELNGGAALMLIELSETIDNEIGAVHTPLNKTGE